MSMNMMTDIAFNIFSSRQESSSPVESITNKKCEKKKKLLDRTYGESSNFNGETIKCSCHSKIAFIFCSIQKSKMKAHQKN